VTFDAGSALETIGTHACNGNAALTSIIIPAGVTAIGSHTFNGCALLATVTFDAGSALQTIGDYAFNGNAALTSIIIPAGVTAISSNAFLSCTSLTSVTHSGYTCMSGTTFDKSSKAFVFGDVCTSGGASGPAGPAGKADFAVSCADLCFSIEVYMARQGILSLRSLVTLLISQHSAPSSQLCTNRHRRPQGRRWRYGPQGRYRRYR